MNEESTNIVKMNQSNSSSSLGPDYAGIGAIISGTFLFIIGLIAVGLLVLYKCFKVYEAPIICNPSSQTQPSNNTQQGSNGSLTSFEENFPLARDVHKRILHLQFSFEEVKEITDNFGIKLGRGRFGYVYLGKLNNGKLVVVKQLKGTSLEVVHKILNEVEMLSRVRHKHLVSLVGYCVNSTEICLIYEFMENGTLYDHLHGFPSEKSPMDWLSRLKVVIGAARGFIYLHHGCDPPIIHRDVKSKNILLDENCVAKVGDFGISKILNEPSNAHISTNITSTWGYINPQQANAQRLTKEFDVYNFGIILLELISGRQVIFQEAGMHLNILEWAMGNIQNGTITNIIDNRLQESYSLESIEHVAKIALQCVENNTCLRPTFYEILDLLEIALNLQSPNKKVLQKLPSEIYTKPGSRIPIVSTNYE